MFSDSEEQETPKIMGIAKYKHHFIKLLHKRPMVKNERPISKHKELVSLKSFQIWQNTNNLLFCRDSTTPHFLNRNQPFFKKHSVFFLSLFNK